MRLPRLDYRESKKKEWPGIAGLPPVGFEFVCLEGETTHASLIAGLKSAALNHSAILACFVTLVLCCVHGERNKIFELAVRTRWFCVCVCVCAGATRLCASATRLCKRWGSNPRIRRYSNLSRAPWTTRPRLLFVRFRRSNNSISDTGN